MTARRSLATRTAELAFAAPQVVAHRVARMAGAGPILSARGPPGFSADELRKGGRVRRVVERDGTASDASATGAVAVLLAVTLVTLDGRTGITANHHADAQRRAGHLNQGIGPVHRTATDNAKRLARTRLR